MPTRDDVGVHVFLKSFRLFVWATVKRFWLAVPGVLLGALGLVEAEFGVSVVIPTPVALGVAAFAWFVASGWAYHDLRMTQAGQRSAADEQRHKHDAIQALDAQRVAGQELLDAFTDRSRSPSPEIAAVRADPEGAVQAWIDNTLTVLRERTHGQAGRFLSDAGLPNGSDRRLAHRLQRRMQRLDEIINALHFPSAEGLIPE